MTSQTGDPVSHDECTIFQKTLESVGRRWSGAILYAGVAGARRFGEYRRAVSGISDKLLTARLRELERQGFIEREVVPTMPVQILYRPTPAGAELMAALEPLAAWGRRRSADLRDEVSGSSARESHRVRTPEVPSREGTAPLV